MGSKMSKDKILHIDESLIIEKLKSDGDLREGDFFQDESNNFEVLDGDDLGFYQQATEYLLRIVQQKQIDKRCCRIFE
jgi:hypothetical protein